ncbi:MAG: hypothetical protein LBG44_03800 [Gemmatimonadota bacterium]|jgi:hypothetical protein|nr:hypothetical protein [Gemmatimonadota bacterium]
MFWLVMTLILLAGGVLILRRKEKYIASENEPWRRSLSEEKPLDIDEIRAAEEEWTSGDSWKDLPEDDSWRA